MGHIRQGREPLIDDVAVSSRTERRRSANDTDQRYDRDGPSVGAVGSELHRATVVGQMCSTRRGRSSRLPKPFAKRDDLPIRAKLDAWTASSFVSGVVEQLAFKHETNHCSEPIAADGPVDQLPHGAFGYRSMVARSVKVVRRSRLRILPLGFFGKESTTTRCLGIL